MLVKCSCCNCALPSAQHSTPVSLLRLALFFLRQRFHVKAEVSCFVVLLLCARFYKEAQFGSTHKLDKVFMSSTCHGGGGGGGGVVGYLASGSGWRCLPKRCNAGSLPPLIKWWCTLVMLLLLVLVCS